MGERHSGDRPSGRRRAHPGGTVAAPGRAGPPGGVPGLERRLGAVLRAEGDPGAERGAMAAFRAARDAGAHDARTRARDDWRPGRPGRARRSARTTLALAFAGLALGSVAVAAVGERLGRRRRSAAGLPSSFGTTPNGSSRGPWRT